jgi:ParB family chromosome partitioning protein
MALTKEKPRQSAPKAAPRRKALGRGLASLMPPALVGGPPVHRQGPVGGPSPSSGHRMLPIHMLVPAKEQPRREFDDAALKELAASIKIHGILQPPVVRRHGEVYQIVAGERRWRAACLAGLQEIPVFIKELSDSHALQIALIENVQRQDLDPLEEAEAYGRLIRDHKLTHDDLAKAVSKSRSAITNSLRLLKLPRAVLELLATGDLTSGHARALMSLEDGGAMQEVAQEIVGRGWSVRDAEARVKRLLEGRRAKKGGKKGAKGRSTAEIDLQDRLTQALGTKVLLEQKRGKGRIEIYFQSLDVLDGLLDRLIS